MKQTYLFFFSLLLLVTSCGNSKRKQMNETVRQTIETSLETLQRSAAEVGDSLTFPTYGENGHWQVRSSKDWVSGFYGGCLWYAYAISGNPTFEKLARKWTMGIEQEKYNRRTHDLGFRFMCTFGNGIRFSRDKAFVDYCQSVRDTAAVTLSWRYHPEFRALSSDWDRKPIEGTTPCVIDIMMNLEILFETARSASDKSLADMAEIHAHTTRNDFIREDGGSYHIVRYNTETGEIVDRGQLQGDVKESTWSRGHAWYVYGMVVAYRYTHNQEYLNYAKEAADYFINHLRDDAIAPWDFQSEDNQSDTSASAVVTSALYELITYLPKSSEREHYAKWADKMLAELCSPDYFTGTKTSYLLDHSVQYYHLNHNVNRAAVFADYYFMEALYRYKNLYL